MWYSNLERTFVSRHILHRYRYTCPPPLQFVETRSIEVFWLLSQVLPHLAGRHLRLSNVLERISRPTCEPLYAANMSQYKQEIAYFLMNVLCIESFRPQGNTTERCSSVVYSSSTFAHFDYWNQPMNMRMRVCSLDCHEIGLCYFLVIHIENLLCPLQLFYFHLWPIYWLPRRWAWDNGGMMVSWGKPALVSLRLPQIPLWVWSQAPAVSRHRPPAWASNGTFD
jgi:hypothetical protein